MNFAVKAETHEGNIKTLRRFGTREAAEDHPVQMSLWKRVWIEEESDPAPAPMPMLPPMPWTIDVVDAGYGGKTNFTYIKDANGRRIMSLLGRPGEKEKMAEFICSISQRLV